MSYAVEFSRPASRYLQRLDPVLQRRIGRAIRAICADPFGLGTKPLRNAAGRRSPRVGDWRVVFGVDEDHKLVTIFLIGPRGDVYQDL